MTEEKLDPEELLVSFDVTSLFTNVPVDEAVEVTRRLLEEDETLGERTALTADSIAELLKLCLKSTYFRFEGKFYEQREGAAMGSPVSAVIANLYMEYFEQRALETAPQRPRLWRRYVDDTCCIVKRGSVDALLDHLNSVRPPIQFTVEQERDGTLPFLDTCIQRKEDGSLDITVYRKPTHTDRYLQYSSHHPQHVKRGLIKCLFNRAEGITLRTDNLRREKKHLTRVLKSNGYPGGFIRSATAPRPEQRSQQEETPTATIAIPYIMGVSEEIRRVCRAYKIRVAFKSGRTIRSLLTRVKDPLPLEQRSMVVYQIPCSCGKVYIGKTIRRLETRLKEHKDACCKGYTEKSAVAEHAWKEQHPIKWRETTVLDHARRNRELLLKEALCIRTAAEGSHFNRDEGAELHECWLATIRKCEGRGQRSRPRTQPSCSAEED